MENTIIRDVNNMSVAELLEILYTHDDLFISETDMYNHIKRNTNGFDEMLLECVINDILSFLMKRNGVDERPSLNIRKLFDKGFPISVQLGEDCEYLKINSIIELFWFFMYNKYVNVVEKSLIDVNATNRIGEYVSIAEIEYKERYVENVTTATKETKEAKPQKQPLTFRRLFKDEYLDKMPLFYSRLENNGLIDKDKNWRDVPRKGNEPAKVYFWLLDRGVMKTANDDTNALICFCKEFGITVYRDTEPTPPADVRKITTKNLLKVKGKITPDEKKRFEQVFSPYLIKQLVP